MVPNNRSYQGGSETYIPMVLKSSKNPVPCIIHESSFFFQSLVKQNRESFGANIRGYSNIPIDGHGTFVEIVPNKIKKNPRLSRQSLKRYVYTRGSQKVSKNS